MDLGNGHQGMKTLPKEWSWGASQPTLPGRPHRNPRRVAELDAVPHDRTPLDICAPPVKPSYLKEII